MRRVVVGAVVAFAVALATGVAASAGDNAGLTPPDPVSPNGERILDAYLFVTVFTGIIFVLVEGALIAFVIKYRRGRRARTAEGPQIHGSTKLEIAWTVLPVVILAAIGTFVLWKIPGIQDPPEALAGDERLEVTIEGHQFYWLFRYPNGAIAIDDMRAPADRVVIERVTAPEEGVIHSWWVPRFGGKVDAVPGHVNETWFDAPAGRYEYRCGELCGVQHAYMNGYVRVLPRDEFRSWVDGRAANSDGVELGREEWRGVCQKCHRLDEEYIGPPLRGNSTLADRDALEVILRRGQGNMPAVGNTWSDEQIDALIAYTRRFANRDTGGGNDGDTS